MSAPLDQPARDRFRSEIERNFSVVASAGSGKTRAITDRVVAMAQRAPELLPDLVVVTFTNRAADEMQQRARHQIMQAGVSVEVVARFNRAFFGTIHSFCLKLLSEHGYRLGLPGTLDLLMDDDELWNDFVQRQTTIGNSLTPANRSMLFRHVQVRALMELGRRANIEASGPIQPGPCPALDVSALLAFVADKRSVETIGTTQAFLREWNEARKADAAFLPMPRRFSEAKKFVELWRDTFTPLRDWLNCCSLAVAAEVQRAYRNFRLERGALTYADQVSLAHELLQNVEAARRIRTRNYRVILDEAQDTDPQQFAVLLEMTRPPGATGSWPDRAAHPPRAGHFSMVGDFQQSIFGERADLTHYRKMHEALLAANAADAVTFSVTFRLDREEIDLINGTFRHILHGEDDQVEFVEMNARPDVLPGQVIRLDLKPAELSDANDKLHDSQLSAALAGELARWIVQTGPENLRTKSWREVAILCPRKAWLRSLRDALRHVGLAVEMQSETDLKGDHPAYAWMTALTQIVAEPWLSYEIVGVLREVFGISDHDLAVFAEGRGQRFQIERLTSGDGVVATKLTLLAKARMEMVRLPLFDAVKLLVEKVRLRERLSVLPDLDEDFDGELDGLLVAAAEAEAKQLTFAAFAKSLRLNFNARREVRATNRNAIQLITAQKAKGSEWQAVIVPFLSRAVGGYSRQYPAMIKNPANGERMVMLSSEDMTPDVKTAVELADRQEMERLLYVALTRAKHTLVLASDGAAFHTARGEMQKNSQMKWLRCDRGDCNEETFLKLRDQPRACAETVRHRPAKTSGGPEKPESPWRSRGRTAAKARANARRFVHKINPSGLSESVTTLEKASGVATDSAEAFHSRFDNAATRYGSWWHELMERIPWSEGNETWSRFFTTQIAHSPDPGRSHVEWDLLLEHFRGASSFRELLTAQKTVAHLEMPFFWNVDPETCLEGIIDLALFDGAARQWLIVDWKTNRIPQGATKTLSERYRPQLAAYAQAVGAITHMQVTAGIFSTATGAFLPYTADEMETEWRRLRVLRPVDLAAEISDDADAVLMETPR